MCVSKCSTERETLGQWYAAIMVVDCNSICVLNWRYNSNFLVPTHLRLTDVATIVCNCMKFFYIINQSFSFTIYAVLTDKMSFCGQIFEICKISCKGVEESLYVFMLTWELFKHICITLTGPHIQHHKVKSFTHDFNFIFHINEFASDYLNEGKSSLINLQ